MRILSDTGSGEHAPGTGASHFKLVTFTSALLGIIHPALTQADRVGAFEESQQIPGLGEGGTPIRHHQAAIRFYQGIRVPRVVEERSSFDRGLCFEQPDDGEAGAVETKTVGVAGYVRLKNGEDAVKPALFRFLIADSRKFHYSSSLKSWSCKGYCSKLN